VSNKFISLNTRKIDKYVLVDIELDQFIGNLGLLDQKDLVTLKDELQIALDEITRRIAP
jgi:hypothetical protein